jgi:hypothetical protein
VDLLGHLELATYAVDIGRCAPGALRDRFAALERDQSLVMDAIGRRLPAVRRAVQDQFDQVWRIAGAGRAAGVGYRVIPREQRLITRGGA